mgnify:CR=1 FL=1
MKIAMIGTGYVGLVSGTCLAEVGHQVTCVDLDENKISLLQDGVSPIYEPGIETYIRKNLEPQRLSFTTNLSKAMQDAEAVFIAVGTPEGEDGSADLRYVEAVAKSIGTSMTKDLLVVVKSTVPVGTCSIVEKIITSQNKLKRSPVIFEVISNPEFLKEGSAITDFMHPDRIVIGVKSNWGEEKARSIYKNFSDKIIVMNRKSSELTKYASNSMLAARISFMNELSELCENVGANIDDIRIGMGKDPRIGPKFLLAGPGYGGSCLPKDVIALMRTAEEKGVELSILKSVMNANSKQKKRLAKKVMSHFSSLKNTKIGIWGLAFKPGTDDVRESPAITLIQEITSAGGQVRVHDPEATTAFKKVIEEDKNITYCQNIYETLEGCNGLVLMTEWSDYLNPNWKKVESLLAEKVVFDFRNQYSSSELQDLGLQHVTVGS